MTDLDLLTERNMQLFIRLAGLADCPITTTMQWNGSRYVIYLSYRKERIHLSQAIPTSYFDDELLIQALNQWQPIQFVGVPQRIFQLSCGLFISCSPPVTSSAELWLKLYRQQSAFLDNLCIPI